MSNEEFVIYAEKYMDAIYRIAYSWTKNPDGTVWVYYKNQGVNITDKFEDEICYLQLKDGDEVKFLIVREVYDLSEDLSIGETEIISVKI